MNMNNNTTISIAILVGLLAIAGAIFIQMGSMTKAQAIDGCLKLVQVQRKAPNGDIVAVPEDYWYSFCMDKKGYKVTNAK